MLSDPLYRANASDPDINYLDSIVLIRAYLTLLLRSNEEYMGPHACSNAPTLHPLNQHFDHESDKVDRRVRKIF